MLCVARTLKDRVDVPLAAFRQILRLALGSMLQLVEKYIEHITKNLKKLTPARAEH